MAAWACNRAAAPRCRPPARLRWRRRRRSQRPAGHEHHRAVTPGSCSAGQTCRQATVACQPDPPSPHAATQVPPTCAGVLPASVASRRQGPTRYQGSPLANSGVFTKPGSREWAKGGGVMPGMGLLLHPTSKWSTMTLGLQLQASQLCPIASALLCPSPETSPAHTCCCSRSQHAPAPGLTAYALMPLLRKRRCSSEVNSTLHSLERLYWYHLHAGGPTRATATGPAPAARACVAARTCDHTPCCCCQDHRNTRACPLGCVITRAARTTSRQRSCRSLRGRTSGAGRRRWRRPRCSAARTGSRGWTR